MNLSDRLRTAGPRVALDTICFVYHFEAHPDFLPATRTLFERIERGEITAVASTLVLAEVLVVPMRSGATGLVAAYRTVLTTFPNLTLVPIDPMVAEKAAEPRARHGLRTPDAIHVASAIITGVNAFITADRALRRVTELEIIVLGGV